MEKGFNIKSITKIATFAVFVFIASKISIPVYLGVGNTRVHFGNILCIMSGFILNKKNGGLAAGLGSFLFDITDPLYIASAPFTFISKFSMAYIAAKFSKGGKFFKGAFIGSISYLVIYICKSFIDNIIISMPLNTNIMICFQKLIVSSINALFAIFISVPITKSVYYRILKN